MKRKRSGEGRRSEVEEEESSLGTRRILSLAHDSLALQTESRSSPLNKNRRTLSALSCKSTPELASVQGVNLSGKQHSPLLP